MKVEAWIFGILTIFFLIVTPVYYLITGEITGSVALTLTFFLVAMITGYLMLIARKYNLRPEDRKDGEIVEGAGEVGFFPPRSIWPLFCAGTMVLVALAPVFGWWLLVIAVAVSFATLTGWIYEYYRGDHAH
jgi:Cytochrome c oxidase subunit IV